MAQRGEITDSFGGGGANSAAQSRTTLTEHALEIAQAVVGEKAMESDAPKNDKEGDPPKERGRIDADDFDIAQPLSNYRPVTDNVSRSGRPLVDKGGLDQLLEKLHPGKDRDFQNRNTVIVELRDEDQQMEKPEITVLNRGEVLAEENMCKTSVPPIDYHRFKMISKQFQSPEKIDDVVSTIEKAVAGGKKVSMHCFHGSDRSGLISAAYLLSADPDLRKELVANPDNAYKEVRKKMIENGCDPASYTTLFQSLKQYCDWKHEQLNGKSGTDGKNPVAVTDVPLDAKGQQRIDAISQRMFADNRFAADPITVYKEELSKVSDDYDPATSSAFYKALRDRYIEGPPPAAKQPDKAGIMWLPQVNLVA